MEKCSFCVQRLQDGKLKAKKDGRVLSDDDVKTACQQACPTHAIVFGNVNNSKSEVVKTRQENEHRLYHVLEELHVLPNIAYFAKVRNPESEAKEKA
jgi:molybdopterin-containing oxidoreductase family iron-sulfur binding subunit